MPLSATYRVGAVVPVHFHGQLAPVEELRAVLYDSEVIVEDAAQSQAPSAGGHGSCAFSLFAAMDSSPGKNLGAYSDIGCITTSTAEIADGIRAMRPRRCTRRSRTAAAAPSRAAASARPPARRSRCRRGRRAERGGGGGQRGAEAAARRGAQSASARVPRSLTLPRARRARRAERAHEIEARVPTVLRCAGSAASAARQPVAPSRSRPRMRRIAGVAVFELRDRGRVERSAEAVAQARRGAHDPCGHRHRTGAGANPSQRR